MKVTKTDMRMIDAVIFMILVLVVQCSNNKRVRNGMDENVLVKMEIEREIALLRFATDEKSVDVRKLLIRV